MTICPLPWVPAGHWRHLDSSCAGGWETSSCMELRASLVGESLTRRSSGPHFLQFYTAPYSSGTGKDSSLWHPSGAGALKEGDLGLTGAGRGHEGLGARTSARGSPLLLGDLPHYVQICRRGKPTALFCFAKGVDIWHNPGNNWLQSCPFLGFPAQGSELDHFLFIKGSYFALILYKQRVMIESTRCGANLFLKDGFWKLE